MTTSIWTRARDLAASIPYLGWRLIPGRAEFRPRVTDAAQLQAVLERIRARHGLPAMAVGIVHREAPALCAVTGRLVAGAPEPVAIAHRFHLGSTTKSVTSLLVAMLVEDGRLRYDLTLAEVLSGLAIHPGHARATLEDLMLGRAGIIAYQQAAAEPPDVLEMLETTIPQATADPRAQRERLAAYVLARSPLYPLGSRSVYSNVGWALVGHVVERAIGTSYEQAVHDRIFAPLAMAGTRIGGWPASSREPGQPRGHYVEPAGLRPQPLDDAYVLAPWMNPAGGIHGPVGDVAAYAREVTMGLQGRGQLLSAAGHARIHTVHARVREDAMYVGARGRSTLTLGYGWIVLELPTLQTSGADGSAGTFYARIVVVPTLDLAFVGITNAGNGAAALAEAIRRCLGLPWR